MTVKLVAIDLDDTLLTDDLVVPPGAAEAIRQAKEAGVHVVIATGRMFPAAAPFARQLELDTPLITYNGAMVRKVDGKMLHHDPIPRGLGLELMRFARDEGWAVQCYFDDRLYVPEINEDVIHYTELAGVPAQSTDRMEQLLEEREATKMLGIGTPEETAERARRLKERFGRRIAVTISKPIYVEMLRPGVSKASGLAKVAEYLGVDRKETMAIGDSFNDVEMLEWAGVGVAMGNGHPEVQARADYVTGTNMEEGVAEALERFVLARRGA